MKKTLQVGGVVKFPVGTVHRSSICCMTHVEQIIYLCYEFPRLTMPGSKEVLSLRLRAGTLQWSSTLKQSKDTLYTISMMILRVEHKKNQNDLFF